MFTQYSLQSMLKEQAERKLTRFQIGFLIYFLLMGPGMLLLALGLSLFSDSKTSLFWLWGTIHSGIFIWLIDDNKNDKICASLLLQAMENGGKDLVWVYTEKIYRDEHNFERIEIHYFFLNKKHGTITSLLSDFEQYQQIFANLFPDISIGYSTALEKHYKNNPASLKSNPQRIGCIKKTISHSGIFNGW
jgi:hypothetical protein